MNIETLKKKKQETKITFDELSEKSGIPKRTLENIFHGITKNPRIDTMQAIEKALDLAPTFSKEEIKEFNLDNNHKVALSDVDRERLLILARAEEVLGKDFVDAHIRLLEIAIEKGSK